MKLLTNLIIGNVINNNFTNMNNIFFYKYTTLLIHYNIFIL